MLKLSKSNNNYFISIDGEKYNITKKNFDFLKSYKISKSFDRFEKNNKVVSFNQFKNDALKSGIVIDNISNKHVNKKLGFKIIGNEKIKSRKFIIMSLENNLK